MTLRLGNPIKLAVACTLFMFFVFLRPSTSYAQLSAYGAIAVTEYGFFNNGSSAFKSDTEGIVAGGFYNFTTDSNWKFGLDGRGSVGVGPRGGEFGGAALRFSYVPKVIRLRPYLQLGGGVVSSTAQEGQSTGPVTQGLTTQPTRFTNGAVELAFGLDIRLTDKVDLRAFDWGGIAGASANRATTTTGSGFFDAGIVYHLQSHSNKK
jgi:hypothetical protein